MIQVQLYSLFSLLSFAEMEQESLNFSLRREAIAGSIPRMESLLRQGAQIDGKAAHGESALEYAIRFGNYKAAIRLLELGANPNIENDSGMTPLHWATKEPQASRVVEALINAGADVNRQDVYGNTALINAAYSNGIRSVAIILNLAKRTVKIDQHNDFLQTPASVSHNGVIAEMLDRFRDSKIRQRDIRVIPLKRN